MPFSSKYSFAAETPSSLYAGERGWGEGVFSPPKTDPLTSAPLPPITEAREVAGQTLSDRLQIRAGLRAAAKPALPKIPAARAQDVDCEHQVTDSVGDDAVP